MKTLSASSAASTTTRRPWPSCAARRCLDTRAGLGLLAALGADPQPPDPAPLPARLRRCGVMGALSAFYDSAEPVTDPLQVFGCSGVQSCKVLRLLHHRDSRLGPFPQGRFARPQRELACLRIISKIPVVAAMAYKTAIGGARASRAGFLARRPRAGALDRAAECSASHYFLTPSLRCPRAHCVPEGGAHLCRESAVHDVRRPLAPLRRRQVRCALPRGARMRLRPASTHTSSGDVRLTRARFCNSLADDSDSASGPRAECVHGCAQLCSPRGPLGCAGVTPAGSRSFSFNSERTLLPTRLSPAQRPSASRAAARPRRTHASPPASHRCGDPPTAEPTRR